MTIKTIADLLGEHPFFVELPEGVLDVVAGCGHNVHFDTDALIIEEGGPADNFYVLRRGRVAIEIPTPRRGPLVVDTLGAGELLGVSWMLPPYRWGFAARAMEPVDAVSLDAACLRGKCDDDPVLGYALYKRFAGVVRERLQATRLQLVDMYGNDAS